MTHSGMLEKKGSKFPHTWKLRFFEQRGPELRYFVKEGDAKPQGTFGVLSFTVIPDREGKRARRIDMYGAGGKLLSVAAMSPESKEEWLAALGAVAVAKPLAQHKRFGHLAEMGGTTAASAAYTPPIAPSANTGAGAAAASAASAPAPPGVAEAHPLKQHPCFGHLATSSAGAAAETGAAVIAT